MTAPTPPPQVHEESPVATGRRALQERAPISLGAQICQLAYDGRALVVVVPLTLATMLLPRAVSPTAVAWLVGVGGLVALGWTGRIWSQIHLGYRLPVRMSLTTCGPYRFLRNPIYCANTLVITGAVTAFGCWWAVPLAVLWCAAFYSAVIRHEEARLRAWHGRAYRAYCDDVARWVPRLAAGGDRCHHRLSPRSLLAELQVPVVLVPAGVKAFGFSALAIGSILSRSWALVTQGRAWFL
jgi:protein-S-isoprenylcysteine O-methyltransferase Ste14